MSAIDAEPKRSPGRPPKPDPARKRYFRCTNAEWQLLNQAADAAGRPRGQIIREAAVSVAAAILEADSSPY